MAGEQFAGSMKAIGDWQNRSIKPPEMPKSISGAGAQAMQGSGGPMGQFDPMSNVPMGQVNMAGLGTDEDRSRRSPQIKTKSAKQMARIPTRQMEGSQAPGASRPTCGADQRQRAEDGREHA